MARTLPSALGAAALLFFELPEGGASGFQLKPNRESGVKRSSKVTEMTATVDVLDRGGI